VQVRLSDTYIDGITKDGEHLSLATFINDNGPSHVNAGMMEYERHPGRVFLVAARELDPGEEIFVLYGAKYWGFASYYELQVAMKAAAPLSAAKETSKVRDRKRIRESSEERTINDMRNWIHPCGVCNENTLRRIFSLHSLHCGDPEVSRELRHLECMPYSSFTAVASHDLILPSRRSRAQHMAESMVDFCVPQTFSHTHMDVVGDREFSFHDVEPNKRI